MSTGKPDRRDGSQLVEVIRDLFEESMVRPLCADLDRLPVAEEAVPVGVRPPAGEGPVT